MEGEKGAREREGRVREGYAGKSRREIKKAKRDGMELTNKG